MEKHYAAMLIADDGCDLPKLEKELVRAALEKAKGNQSAAARLLRITRYQLRYRMQKLDHEAAPCPPA